MRNFGQAPPLPGHGRPNNLVKQSATVDVCPCCGAAWKGGKPWTETSMTPAEMALECGMTQQAITQRIRRGTIAAYHKAGSGARNDYLIPISEVKRVMAQDPLDGGARPEKTAKVKDLGVKRG